MVLKNSKIVALQIFSNYITSTENKGSVDLRNSDFYLSIFPHFTTRLHHPYTECRKKKETHFKLVYLRNYRS